MTSKKNPHYWDQIKMVERKKIFYLVVTIILFLVGYFIAPSSMEDGVYDVKIVFQRENVKITGKFQVTLDSSISQASNLQTANFTTDNFLLQISYNQKYSGKLNSKIYFLITVFENEQPIKNLKIQEISGLMSNNDTHIKLSPTAIKENQVEINFRVLKQSKIALGLLFMISFLWLSEIVPLAASSLVIPVIIVIFRIDTASGSLSQFFSPVIALFLAGFLMAEAMKRTKLDQYVSLQILSRVPANAQILALALMGMTAVFSMFMSNTAAAAVFIPLSITLLDNLEHENPEYRKMVILGIAYSATLGGIGSLIGTPPNLIAVEFLQGFNGTEITFLEWFFFGLPVLVSMIPIMFGYLWIRYKPSVPNEELREAKNHCITALRETHHLTLDQIIVAIVFVIVFSLWLTTQIHGISAGIIAIVGAVLLYFTGQIKEKDLNRINWNALITFGGGLTLGLTILRTGLADWIALQLGILKGIPPIITLLILGAVALLLTAIASNTASASILVPIVMPLGLILGLDPVLTAVVVSIVCSIDFAIVIGTPPTMIAYSTGIYKVKEIFQIGIFLDLIGLLVVTVIAWFFYQNFLYLILP